VLLYKLALLPLRVRSVAYVCHRLGLHQKSGFGLIRQKKTTQVEKRRTNWEAQRKKGVCGGERFGLAVVMS
jgi:hypothetical protein